MRLNPPLSLYVHFPWCIRKCPYCDFNSHKLNVALDESKYVDTLIKDLENDLSILQNQRKLKSIFLGGGTPSLFSAKSMQRLILEISARIELDENIEITMEANPGSVEHDQFSAYREAAINRISLGVQSFNDAQLHKLGRIHNSTNALNAITAISDAGFDNFNLDIMYALPGQSISEALNDCQLAIDNKPNHLSFYQLTIEPNTLFHKYPPAIPDSDHQLEIQTAVQRVLSQNDYLQYEVSAYAKADAQCLHNLNYWNFGDYLGIGAGAHSKITTENKILRSWKHKQPEHYIDKVKNDLTYTTTILIKNKDRLFELMLNGLRLKKGLDANTISQNAGLDFQEVEEKLKLAIHKNLIVADKNNIRCTNKGYLFIDEILQDLLTD